MFLYPENLRAKATLWLWELRDVGVIGFGVLLTALLWGKLLLPTCLYAFLTIRVEENCILDFLRHAVNFLFAKQQYYEWRERIE